MKKLQLPYGVQDYLPKECFNKKIVEEKLSKLFYLHGFEQVQTTSLEYFDTFSEVLDNDNLNHMFKMTDNDGRLLVLRPDITVQICRLVASKYDVSKVNKFYYVANSFEYLPNKSTARNREFEQVGIEVLGKSGDAGDLDILTLAIEGMLSAGLSDFLIEIGNIKFMKGLLQEGGINDSDGKQLRRLVNNKDMLGVEMFLQERNLSEDFISKFLFLPALFGDESVLTKAQTVCSNELCLSAINNLKYIINGLKKRKLDKYVSIDLGMVQGEYYTGMILRGVAKNFGVSLLDGGRYDNLGDSFNAPMEAVGFAIGAKRLLMALESQNKLVELERCDYAYISDDTQPDFEYEEVCKLRKEGKRVTKYYYANEIELEKYCLQNKILNAFKIVGRKKITLPRVTLLQSL